MEIGGESPVTNFPATVTRLYGRSAVMARLRDFISAFRLVTLTGPGGIGKTSLALKVARGVVGEFADGAWLVELASLSDPTLVPSAAAGALRLGLGPDMVTAEAVAHAIGDKKLLLVLDNCEHLIAAAASLAETLLAALPLRTRRSWRRAAKSCVSRGSMSGACHRSKCRRPSKPKRPAS